MRCAAPRCGFTLLELLLALGLLSALVVVMLSWTSVAADSAGAFAGQVNWERSARAALRMIAEDVAGGDFEQPQRRGASRPPRVTINSDQLTIQTRTASGSSEERWYRLERGKLRTAEGVLLENVSRFTSELDEDEQWLEVTIDAAPWEKSITRRVRLP